MNHNLDDPTQDSYDLVIGILPLSLVKRIEAIPAEVLEKTNHALEHHFNLPERLILKRLRTTFWIEADRAISTGARFLLKSVYEGFCERSYFSAKVTGNSHALAYLLRRHAGYGAILEEMLIHGLEIQREILDLPIVDEEGRIDMKVLEIKNKIVEATHNRLKGTPISRTQIHQTNEQIPSRDPHMGLPESDIRQRIKELEALEAKKR